jgi:riboflavin synthase
VFTGIVEEIGEVLEMRRTDDVVVLTVRGPTVTSDARLGDSIAVNGVCLTVTGLVSRPADDTLPDAFRVELVPETLARSSFADVAPGARVNLERAVAVGGRLGGHIVQGHVDGVGTLLNRNPDARRNPGARSDELRFALPSGLARYVVEKGSITVDGVSLTVAATDGATFTVALIPTTLAHTTLGARAPGDTVNLEVDVVAKYVERLTAGYEPSVQGSTEPGSTARAASADRRTVEQ